MQQIASGFKFAEVTCATIRYRRGPRHAAFDLPARAHGHRGDLADRQVRSGQLSVVHAGLHRRLFRHRRHRLDQDRAPLRQRHGPAAIERPEGGELHHGRGVQRRGARSDLRPEAEHPAVGQDPDHPRDARLSARGRHDHGALRRPAPGLARHARADLCRADLRVPRARRRVRDLQLRRAAGAADDLDRRRPAGDLEGGPADPAPRRRAFPARLQGRGQMGQSERPGRGHVLAAGQSPGRAACRRRFR